MEAASNNGPAEIITQVLPVTQVHGHAICRIFAESAGSSSLGGLQSTINGHNTNLSSVYGIRIAVMKEKSCEVESYAMLYSYAYYNLARMIADIPTGRIVIASAYGSATANRYYSNSKYRESANQALESIGSSLFRSVGQHDAWAIIGKKGASPGSVPESFIRSISQDGSSAVAVGGTMKLSQPCMDELYPLDCLLSGESESRKIH